MPNKLAAFHDFRSRMNEKLLTKGNLQLKRFFNLDSQVYTDGALPSRTKELMGLVASAVLRCDDCITYHMIRCAEEGVTDEEFFETFNVILVVGGPITIPHVRRAVETLEEIRETTVEGMAKQSSERLKKKGKGLKKK
jgi:AhpD family alkylhydroperoxidase